MSKGNTAKLEAHFKTKNDHYNDYAFRMVEELLKIDLFDDPLLAMGMYSSALDYIQEHSETPIQTVEYCISEFKRNELNPEQLVFVLDKVYSYLRNSEYEGIDLGKVKKVMKSKLDKLKPKSPQKPKVKGLKATIKDVIDKELKELPKTLESLEPEKKLNIICKLLPYVVPKVETVSHRNDENGLSFWG